MKFWGKVRIDNQRGKTLGFPTANINLYKAVPEGIYISKAKLNQSIYQSLTFIGPTKTAETYILDFNQDIYDKWISVELLKKIRENKKFNSDKELITEMKKDETIARKYFNSFAP